MTAFALFLLGLLTKTVVATLPGVLLVIAWWRRGELSWRSDVLPLLPWFVVGAGGGLVTAGVERSMLGAEGAAFDWTLAERCVLAGRAAWFYLAKLLWPSPLLFVYPRWSFSAAWPWPLVPLSVGWRARRVFRRPAPLAWTSGRRARLPWDALPCARLRERLSVRLLVRRRSLRLRSRHASSSPPP